MNPEELIAKANNNDAEAMIELTGYYADRQDWNEAIDWADKAADAGNSNGMYKAAALHNLRMSSLLKSGVPFWDLMKEDARAVQKNAGVLLAACRNGMINLEDKIFSNLLGMFREALYCEAVICYADNSNDYARALHLLKDVDTAREQTLCGLCYFELDQYEDAKRVLDTVYRDADYLSESKCFSEETIFSVAMLALSMLTRMDGNPDKAVMILNRTIEGLNDEDNKEQLCGELGKYQKKMFGGWKYAG